MINLFRFLIRYGSFFLFVVFELIALYLVVNYNRSQRNIFINSSNKITGTLLEKYDQVSDYFNLVQINQTLNQENAILLKTIEKLKSREDLQEENFEFREAKIISNHIDGRYNKFLINRGHTDGIRKGMGVLYNNRPAGIIYQVTSDHASAISLLNINLHLSASIKGTGQFGTLIWQPPNPKNAALNSIPSYADIQVGDTVTTSGYSQVFPAGLPIATVVSVQTPTGSNYYEIDLSLLADLGSMNYVQIVENINQSELDSLKMNIR